MWKIFIYEVDYWQRTASLAGAKNVQISSEDDDGSIIFMAMPRGVEKWRNLWSIG